MRLTKDHKSMHNYAQNRLRTFCLQWLKENEPELYRRQRKIFLCEAKTKFSKIAKDEASSVAKDKWHEYWSEDVNKRLKSTCV